MKTKDCFFGQIRAATETFNGKPTTWTPTAMGVTKQWAQSWNNTTGMNPLWDKSPVETEYYSYGNMLAWASRRNHRFINDYIDPHKDGNYYDQKIKADYAGHEARLCFLLAIPFGIHTILAQPDVLDYDFIVARQFDTWYDPLHGKINEQIEYMLREYPKLLSHATTDIHNIPIAFAESHKNLNNPKEYDEFPVIGASRAPYHIFNRAAVERLTSLFLPMMLQEFENVHQVLGTDQQSQIMSAQPGYIIHRALTKCDVHVMDMEKFHILRQKPGWNVRCSHDFSHIARATGDSD